MSKNSQKLNLTVYTDWLKDINPKSESLQQPIVIVDKPFYKKPLRFK